MKPLLTASQDKEGYHGEVSRKQSASQAGRVVVETQGLGDEIMKQDQKETPPAPTLEHHGDDQLDAKGVGKAGGAEMY